MDPSSSAAAKSDLAKFVDRVRSDLTARGGEFPDQTLLALANRDVQRALAEHLEAGSNLVAVEQVGYNPFSKITQVLFGFAGQDGELHDKGVLVLTDFRCRVVGIDGSFALPRPGEGYRLPPVRMPGPQPFALMQPSLAGGIVLPLVAGDVSGLGGAPGPDDGPGGPVGPGGGPTGPTPTPGPDDGPGGPVSPGGGPTGLKPIPGTTKLSSGTSQCTDVQTAVTGPVCKQTTGLLAPHCDAWGTYYQTDCQGDQVEDDQGEAGIFNSEIVFDW